MERGHCSRNEHNGRIQILNNGTPNCWILFSRKRQLNTEMHAPSISVSSDIFTSALVKVAVATELYDTHRSSRGALKPASRLALHCLTLSSEVSRNLGPARTAAVHVSRRAGVSLAARELMSAAGRGRVLRPAERRAPSRARGAAPGAAVSPLPTETRAAAQHAGSAGGDTGSVRDTSGGRGAADQRGTDAAQSSGASADEPGFV